MLLFKMFKNSAMTLVSRFTFTYSEHISASQWRNSSNLNEMSRAKRKAQITIQTYSP